MTDEDDPVVEHTPEAKDTVEETKTDAPATAAPGAAEPSVAPKGRRLTPAEWIEIINHREYDTMATNDICAKFGITVQAISSHIKNAIDRGAKATYGKKGSKKHLLAVRAAPAAVATPAAVDDFESRRKDRIERSKETLYRQSEALQAIHNQVLKEIIESKGAIKASDRLADLKAIRVSAAIISETADTRYRLLDIDKEIDERAMPILQYEDLSDEEIEAMREKDDEDEDALDLDISVTDEDDIVET